MRCGLRPYVQPINSEGNLPEVIGENFKEYLESVRSQLIVVQPKGKRFHLPVEPGKSVSYEEVQTYVTNRELSQTRKEGAGKKRQANQKNNSSNKLKKMKKKQVNETHSEEEEFVIQEENADELENPIENSLLVINSASHEQLKKNDYVIVQFEGSYFPGQISGFDVIDGEIKYLVNAMSINGKNWRWPENKDEIYYDEKDVKKIDPLYVVPVTTRGAFKIEDNFLNENWCNLSL